MKIVWKDGMGSFYNGVKAEDIVSELNKISTESITPEQVLDAARYASAFNIKYIITAQNTAIHFSSLQFKTQQDKSFNKWATLWPIY